MTTTFQFPPFPRPASLDDHGVVPSAGKYSDEQLLEFGRACVERVFKIKEAELSASATPFTLDDILDALNVFNPPSNRPSLEEDAWNATDAIVAPALPDFVWNMIRAWSWGCSDRINQSVTERIKELRESGFQVVSRGTESV